MPVQCELIEFKDKKPIFVISLSNKTGMKAKISNYGGILQSLLFPVTKTETIETVIGFEYLQQYYGHVYLENYAYLGAAIGRYANQISNGKYTIDGKEIILQKNIGPDHLHGGIEGFDKKIWNIKDFGDVPIPYLKLSYESPHLEENYPGNLRVMLTFTLSEANELCIQYDAITDTASPVNLTHHSYFNLDGINSSVSFHRLRLNASYYLQQDDRLNCTGLILPVADSRYDFREERQILFNGETKPHYDQSFVLDEGTNELRLAAEVWSSIYPLKMTVKTTEPVVQFYTACDLSLPNTELEYGPYSAFCLETQRYPNAVNIPSFPDTILRKGENYHAKTIYQFTTTC